MENYVNELDNLVKISQKYGRDKAYVIGGGGNTSFKSEDTIWVKPSGVSLADIRAEDFIKLDRNRLNKMSGKTYSSETDLREKEVALDLAQSALEPEKKQRPSVESSMHNSIRYKYVVHTHPTLINSLLCSKGAKESLKSLFALNDAIYLPYIDPGYTLFMEVEKTLQQHREKFGKDPRLIFLGKHGIFVAADTVEEIRQLYDEVADKLLTKLGQPAIIQDIPIDEKTHQILPALRMLLSPDNINLLAIRNDDLAQSFAQSASTFEKISVAFTPDMIVYCRARALYIATTGTPHEIIENFKVKLQEYLTNYGFYPRIVLIKGIGLITVAANYQTCQIQLDVFEDLMKIARNSEAFGGPGPLEKKEIAFIENWEVENYRRAISTGSSGKAGSEGTVIIITGGAQGFGGGVAEEFFKENTNLVIADINETAGKQFVENLNKSKKKNQAIFVKTDVSDARSVKNLIFETVKNFGGFDVFISNAGILRAGSLEEMEPEVFDLVTKVNYNAYFLCTKYASEVLKLQTSHKQGYFADIIQINSKSGLRGSNKNFAYSGGKFGGVGLTQSFALELMPYRIKVNSICPGNFFDGPLWSDPNNGLFVQYLRTGKVPGAKTIDDVKKFYEAQVPAKRGCQVKDVMKAIYYIMDQEYETGQAMPVTGGQVMLN